MIEVFWDVLCVGVKDLIICVMDFCVFDFCFVIVFNLWWIIINKIKIGNYYFVCRVLV